ncbi:MAG: PadR family transcriptional regulator [Planctomycetales bacterium]|nr:PadR family transcriptional regulator [Planctomycetales bacterium]
MPRDNAVADTGKFQKELNSGILSLIVLSILRVQGEQYGYDLVRMITSEDGEAFPMTQGAVYPVLRSLEKQKLLISRLQPSEAGPPRKYYRVTPAGELAFKHWSDAWYFSVSVVNRFVPDPAHAQNIRPSLGRRTIPNST